VQQIGAASLSPLMAGSPLNVDDTSAYSPLLDVGRLVRAQVATMPHLTALDVSKYRPIFDGRIDRVSQADEGANPLRITISCSDLGSWLMDLQVETGGVQYGTTPVGTALETVIQSAIDDTIPVGEPAVTLTKQSASSFAVTNWILDEGSLLGSLGALVLDTVGEDLRYRYDAAHAAKLTWFNPDRTRVTVDATFSDRQYVLRSLDLSIANVRNAGEMPYPGGTATSTDLGSIDKYRRRFFRMASSSMITTLGEAQTVIDAAVNDLSAPPGEAAADLVSFFWPVQLWDRYTFTANSRQFDANQTFAVMGYEHTIESARGSTTLTLTERVVGAYDAWKRRISGARPILLVQAEPDDDEYVITWSGATLVQVAIDGGAYGTPSPSPITVPRTLSDQTYAFTATANGVTTPPTIITIPALPAGTGFFTSVSQALFSAIANQITFSWGWSGSPAYFEVYVREDGSAWNYVGDSGTGDTSFVYTTSYDLGGTSPTSSVLVEFYLRAMTPSGPPITESEINSRSYLYTP
jgi:hypothetical protein